MAITRDRAGMRRIIYAVEARTLPRRHPTRGLGV